VESPAKGWHWRYSTFLQKCEITGRVIQLSLNSPKPKWRSKLHPKQFKKSAPGKLIRSPSGHWTFEPAPLPPAIKFDIGLVNQLSEADHALGELAGIGRMLPNPHLLIRPFLRREAILSSRIEGTVARLEQLLLFELQTQDKDQPEDVAEVANYVNALEYGLARLKTLPICLRLLCEIHERLLEGVRGADKRPGQFRNCQVMIGRKDQSLEDARFVPPDPTRLPSLLGELEKFLNAPGDLPIIVQLALAHYQFETIHPFMDGNGRIGRLLITLMLCAQGCLPQPLLYLSAYLEKNSEAYKDHLLDVSQTGNWTEWIRFFAQGVAEQSLDAIRRAKRIIDLWQHYRQSVQETYQSVNLLRLIDELIVSPFITIRRAQEVLAVSYTAAQNNIENLEITGILVETTNRYRNRIYVAQDILDLLGEKDLLLLPPMEDG
jgi:Fic family protein